MANVIWAGINPSFIYTIRERKVNVKLFLKFLGAENKENAFYFPFYIQHYINFS